MTKLLRRRIREEDLLLFNRLETLLKLKIMEQEQNPTNIHHPRYVKEGRADEIKADHWVFSAPDTEPDVPKDDNNDTIIYLESSPEEGACVDNEELFTRRVDPYFQMSNLLVGASYKIKYIVSLLEGEPSRGVSDKAINELNKLSSKVNELDNLIRKESSWCP